MSTVKISDSGGREVSVTTDKALKVDGSGATQPVSVIAGNNVIGQVKLTDGTDVADVLDLPNSNPLTVAIVDANGDQIASFGGGTQYTEDVASVADPVGNQLIARRRDALGAETTTDGDNVAVNSTNKGELYVKHVDSIPVTDNGSSLTVDAINLDIRDLTFAADKVDASGTVLGAGTNNIGDVDVLTLPAITGTVTANAGTDLNTSALALEATLGTRLSESDFDSKIGSLTEAAPGTDTASSGLNGRLQRIAQRISSLITALGSPFQAGGSIGNTTFASTVADGANVNQGANADAAVVTDTTGTLSGKLRGLVKWAYERMPAALGQTTMANSLPVSIASNQSAVPVSGTVAVTGVATLAEQQTQTTALQLIDDAVVTDDAPFTPATTKVIMSGYEYDDTGTDSVNEGDAGAARMSANRNIYFQLRDAAGNERGANVNATNELKVDASGQYLNIGSILTNKTPNITFISQQQVAANGVVVGSGQALVYAKNAVIGIWFGRRSATASTGPVKIRIEGNNTYAGSTGYWTPITTYTTDYAAVEAEAVSGTANAGATTINVSSTANLAVGDIVYFDNGTAGNSEWHRIKSIVTNTSITLEEALSNAQTGSTIYNGAEITTTGAIDVFGYYYIRVVVDGALFTQNYMIRCFGSYNY